MSKRNHLLLFLSILCFLFCILFLNLFLKNRYSNTCREQFQQLTEKMFQNEVVSSTLNLHYTLEHPENYGITNYPVTYGDQETVSLVSYASPTSGDYLRVLSGISYDSLTDSDRLTYDILALYLDSAKQGERFRLYYEPLGPTLGIQAQLPILLSEYTFHSPEDIQVYLALAAQTDSYFSSILAHEQARSQAGLFMSDENADAIIRQCCALLDLSEEENFFLSVFHEKISQADFLSEEEKQSCISQNAIIVSEHILPAYQLLAEGLAALKGTGKNTGGLCYFPEGKAYYEYLLCSSTGSYLPVTGIEKRICQQITSDLTECRELLKKYPSLSDSETLFSSGEEDPSLILADLQEKMTADFPTAPQVSCTVKYVHPSLEDYLSPAFYLTPPIDNTQEHVIYINPASGYSWLELYTTLAHEGYPGHLYQNISFDAENEPIRSLLNFGGYTEGWATYVEMESYRYAAGQILETQPLSEEEVYAAARFQAAKRSLLLGISSLLDIRIHYHGFSLEDTERFLSELGFFQSTAASSIYQTILEAPANYLKYYLGYLTFLDLRSYFQENYPDRFDLRDFHRQILAIGPCQFPVLEKYLKACYE